MRPFVIYYDDGRDFAALGDGVELELAPCDGVIAIAQADDACGREILHMKDFYYWERGRWFGCDLYGMHDYLRRPGWKKIVAGRNVEWSRYAAIFERACTLDDRLPAKTARLPSEAPRR